jgi:5-methylcytosine-specific restriction enzyme subunit McrC
MSPPRTIQFTEAERKRIYDGEGPGFTREDALAVLQQYGDYLDVGFAISDGHYELQSKGSIGHFPVADDLFIIITPKVPISNLFKMLEYAFDLESFEILPGETHIETVEELFERFASILAQRVLLRVSKGLYSSYFSEVDLLARVRGRVCIAPSIRHAARGVTKLCCTYQEHSFDVEDNRILFWTLYCLRWLVLRPGKAQQQVRLAYRALLGSVTLERIDPANCLGRPYHRLNDDYQPMHRLCALLLRLLGPGLHEGEAHLLPFRVHMPSLFESFVFRWLKEHLEQTTPEIEVKKKFEAHMRASFELSYEMDIVLLDRKTDKIIAVLDAKYKRDKRPGRDDLHQVAIYAKLARCSYAILIYPSLDTKPEEVYFEDVTIKSLVFDIGQSDLDAAGTRFLSELCHIVNNNY